MNSLKKLLKIQLFRYLKIQEELKKKKYDGVEGSLVILNTKRKPAFYHSTKNPQNGKFERRYIKKDEIDLVRILIQKQYDKKLKKLVDRRISQFLKLYREYEDDELGCIYENTNELRKPFINTTEVCWKERLSKWKSTPYIANGFPDAKVEIRTIKNEVVRSKSEKILADLLTKLGIEYKYECPLVLDGRRKVFPDFTILHPITFQEIYWEHFGMMDNPLYANKALEKIKLYQRNNLFIGERLLVTFESSESGLDYDAIEEMIKAILS